MEPRERKRGYRDPDRHAKLRAAAQAPIAEIRHIRTYPPGTIYVPVGRVSDPDQKRDGNDTNQHAAFVLEVEAHGGKLLEFCKGGYVGRADLDDPDYLDWLDAVTKFARENNAVPLAATRNRLIRHYTEDGRFERRPPEPGELKNLSRACHDTPMALLLEPESLPGKEHGFLTRLGQAQKENKGGRPKNSEPEPKREPGYKKQRRGEKEPEVWRLYCQGTGIRAIGRALKIDKRTVGRWVGRFLIEGKTK